jgi:hypothetical protein
MSVVKEIKRKTYGKLSYIVEEYPDGKYAVVKSMVGENSHIFSSYCGIFDSRPKAIHHFNTIEPPAPKRTIDYDPPSRSDSNETNEQPEESKTPTDLTTPIPGKRRRRCSVCGEMKFGVETYHKKAICSTCIKNK